MSDHALELDLEDVKNITALFSYNPEEDKVKLHGAWKPLEKGGPLEDITFLFADDVLEAMSDDCLEWIHDFWIDGE